MLVVFLFAFSLGSAWTTDDAFAVIMATGFFSGTIESFDEQTLDQSTFATIASDSDPFPGLASIAYDHQTDRLYTSARISGRIYTVDATTGSVLGFHQLPVGSQPAGLAIDAARNLYVANSGANSVSVFDSNWQAVDTITIPDIGLGDNLPTGLAFDDQNRLVISTFAGGGLFRYDPGTDMVMPLAASPLANGQVAIDQAGNILVGGAAFSSDVRKFDSSGTEVGSPFLTIDDTLLPQPPLAYASPDFTSPSGIALDGDGNLIVTALGRTNPTNINDNFQNNGGLFKFSSSGAFIDAIEPGITPLSDAAVVPTAVIPEPGTAVLIVLGALVTLAGFYRKVM